MEFEAEKAHLRWYWLVIWTIVFVIIAVPLLGRFSDASPAKTDDIVHAQALAELRDYVQNKLDDQAITLQTVEKKLEAIQNQLDRNITAPTSAPRQKPQ